MFFKNRGFTIVELLVTVAIIGLLSTLAVILLSDARSKARDGRRIDDLAKARTAFFMYHDAYGNWVETGSGCGSGGNGLGWFSYAGGSYPKSIAQCLVDGGFSPKEIIDPSGDRSCTPTVRYAYMKYHCGNPVRVYIYAKLETEPQSATATDGTCCPGCDSSYGMNYYLQIQ
jgi:prepilin-type N-terminal cleavage/methylation domain-containing protein